jgi:hypothetical protein
VIAAMVLAVVQNYPVGHVESWNRASHEQRIAIIQQIKTDCKLPLEAMALLDDGTVVIQPPPDTPYEAVDCMLHKIKAQIGFSKVGFIGNEQIAEEKK